MSQSNWTTSQLIDQYKQRHEYYLQHLINDTSIPAQQIREALNYALFPGGKRIRPILVYLSGELLGVNLDVLDVIAAAIELTHSYSLIHDDLPAMDDDDFRRGKSSCHKAYDEATAILAGDGLQALGVQVLLTRLAPLLRESQVIAVTLELLKASGLDGMISGQSLDLVELKKTGLTETRLSEIHYLKTGKLISACTAMVLASLDFIEDDLKTALQIYVNNIGLVFQIQDDYLDQFAPHQALGKGRSSDAANQKTTFATLFSEHQLKEKIDQHYQIALSALELFSPKSDALIELTKQLQARTSI